MQNLKEVVYYFLTNDTSVIRYHPTGKTNKDQMTDGSLSRHLLPRVFA